MLFKKNDTYTLNELGAEYFNYHSKKKFNNFITVEAGDKVICIETCTAPFCKVDLEHRTMVALDERNFVETEHLFTPEGE